MQEINFPYDPINRNISLVNNMQRGFVNVLTKVTVNFEVIFSKIRFSSSCQFPFLEFKDSDRISECEWDTDDDVPAKILEEKWTVSFGTS